MKSSSLFLIAFYLLSGVDIAQAAYDVEAELRRFHSDPKTFMSELPPKSSSLGVKPRAHEAFNAYAISTRQFINKKDSVRRELCMNLGGERICPQTTGAELAPFEAIGPSPDHFFEGVPVSKDIRELDRTRKLTIQQRPWSDSYWPLYKGALGNRFADPTFPGSMDWTANFNYARSTDIFGEFPKDQLAPSEKYDLMLGDRQRTLTGQMWNMGRYYQEAYGKVETWMGLCHGWAAASYMLPRPSKSVEVLAADGRTKVRFLPSDIKALATLLWANSSTDTLFVGGRCNDKNPQYDENGRIVSPNCFDTNPGVWHLALVNRLRASRPFVFDASFDYEVWNQPVISYSYSYFNPQTLEQSEDLQASVIPAAQYQQDKFKRYRSPQTKYFVGIAMQVHYLSETQPSIEPTDSPDRDSIIFVNYLYDLELDQNMNVIGGEWYYNAHPDFIWTPTAGSRVLTPGDYGLTGKWQADRAIPQNWASGAQRSAGHGMPLASIVETLIQWAQ
ncbi:MAG TPA: hypothetical protein VFV50_10245 [Bdellovibrionales bacterium]|nr:hypothetical protein [Bdellovibrionales bacterium]